MRILWSALAAVVISAVAAGAQCKVPIASNEGKLLAFYTVPLVFSAATEPEATAPGSIRIGFEGEYIPKPNPEIQRTGKCFLQKSEHTSLSPVFGRPRITIGLPASFAIEGSYLPPVTIADAKPNLGSVAISHTQRLPFSRVAGGATLMIRANATFGNVKGPITCPKSSLQTTNTTAACYGTTPSNDTFSPNMYGIDLLAGVRPPLSVFGFYAGAGANQIDPHFQVGFTNGQGGVDRTRVQLENPVTRLTLTAGTTAHIKERIDFGAQVFSVPQDVTTFRIGGGITFR
jgi:hypothetical protein